MIISCIGDSLTEGDYGVKGRSGIANVHKENYPYYLSEYLRCEVRNFGKCGYRSTTMLDYYDRGNVHVAGSDIVLIMLGSNGGQDPDADTAENRAYLELLSRIRQDAPGARIILITPPHATSDPRWSNCGYAEQVGRAVAFTRITAEKQNLELIDLSADPRLQAGFEDYFQSNDGLHFNALGYSKIAERVYWYLKRFA